MNKIRLEYLSSHLKSLRNQLADARHGGLVLTGDELESFIGQVECYIKLARDLEECISSTEWNDRAAADRARLLSPSAATIVELMRPNTNIVAFPNVPPRSPLGGGSAA